MRVHPYRLRAPFAHVGGVRGYQIVQRPDGLLVRLVPGSSGSELGETVAAAVAQALTDAGADVPVRVEPVAEIEREPGPAAKVKLVRSEL